MGKQTEDRFESIDPEKIKKFLDAAPESENDPVSLVMQIIDGFPEDGRNLAEYMRETLFSPESIHTYTNMYGERYTQHVQSTFKNFSDEQVLELTQFLFQKTGLHDFAKNVSDGHLSKQDIVDGLAEYGHNLNARKGGSDVPSPEAFELGQNILKHLEEQGLDIDIHKALGLAYIEQELNHQAINFFDDNFVKKPDDLGFNGAADPDSVFSPHRTDPPPSTQETPGTGTGEEQNFSTLRF